MSPRRPRGAYFVVGLAAVAVLLSLCLSGLSPGREATGNQGVGFPTSSHPAVASPSRYNVVFVMGGLPAGASWSVTLGNETMGPLSSPNTTALVFSESNGTYPFSVNTSSGLAALLGSGAIQVNGENQSIYDRALPNNGSTVEFTESGLPAGSIWAVGLAPYEETWGISGSSVNFTLPSGHFAYNVRSPTTPNRVISLCPLFRGLCPFNVSFNNPVHIFAHFTIPYYWVNFTASGSSATILKNEGWTLVFNGTVENESSASAALQLTNGSYPMLPLAPRGYNLYISNACAARGCAPSSCPYNESSGLLMVTGDAVCSVAVSHGGKRSATFVEHGLPVGQPWCMQIDGFEECSTGTTIEFGGLSSFARYNYSLVSPRLGQDVKAHEGKLQVPVTGSLVPLKSVRIVLQFRYFYPVTFVETGLTSGTWSVTVNGHTDTALWNQSIQFNLSNGTYAYKVGPEIGYKGVGAPPKAIVNGSGAPVQVTFTKKA